MASRDNSNLQIAMKALLAIIAGLLVADMLKAVVNTARRGSPADVAIVLGAAFFLFRIVVDNILFYEIKDATAKAYLRRVFLILLDLISYGFLYYIVAVLDASGEKWSTHIGEVRHVLGAIALIELLHAAWCFVWLWALPSIQPADRNERQGWLASWGILSAVFAALAWYLFCRWTTQASAYLLLAYGCVSTFVYILIMEKHYTGKDSDYSDSGKVTATPPGGTP